MAREERPGGMSYLGFLQAVNVGRRTVKMADLRQALNEAGYTRVRTALQSGNIMFETTEPDPDQLATTIENLLQHRFGFPIGVHLRHLGEVERIVLLDPFRDVEVTPEFRCCVLFVDTPLPAETVLPRSSPANGVTILGATTGEIFLVLRLVNGRPADATRFLTDLYLGQSVKATMRYMSAVTKILAVAHSE